MGLSEAAKQHMCIQGVFADPGNFPKSWRRKCFFTALAAMSQSKEPATSALTGQSPRGLGRGCFSPSVLCNCNRLATRQTGGHFQRVGRNKLDCGRALRRRKVVGRGRVHECAIQFDCGTLCVSMR
jgi:hypothetical protein